MCLKNELNNNASNEDPNQGETIITPADFQTAISKTGFGKFNIFLLLILLPSTWVSQSESTIISYIIPVAACDLNLTLNQKSLMNSMSFIGMITSGFCWGFLLDTLGRRKIIVFVSAIEFAIMIFTSLAQTFEQLAVLKLLGGITVGGMYVALNTYIQEFHETKHRGRIQMIFASFYCICNMVLPLAASLFLPLDFNAKLFGVFQLHGWNLFILASSLTAAICFSCFYFLPESPKFLMSAGRNDEALKIFQTVFSINTGQPKAAYPIFKLIEEVAESNDDNQTKSLAGYIKLGWEQIAPLFGKTHLPKLLLVGLLQSTYQMCMNSLRIYLPQIFQATHDYKIKTNISNPALCLVLEELRHKPSENGDEILCSVNLEDNFQVYLNSIVIGAVTMGAYILGGSLVNVFGKRKLLNFLGLLAVACLIGMYFSQDPTTTLLLSSTYLSCVTVCYDIMVMIVVVIFPTTLRAMAFSVNLILGRSLTVFGNMLFPILVEVGCAPPFFTLAGLILVTLILSCLLPDTEHSDLK